MILCPICEEEILMTVGSFERHLNIEPHVIDLVNEVFPAWVEGDGTSPRAVFFYRSMLKHQNW